MVGSMRSRPKKAKIQRARRFRNSSGSHLIELLVSMVVGALIALALTNFFSESMRLSTSSRNVEYARSALASLIDFTRKSSYSFLVNNCMGEYSVLVNRHSSGETECPARSATPGLPPALMDLVYLTWTEKAKNGKFSDDSEVKFLVEPGPASTDPTNPETIKITISASWKDGINYDQSHTVSTSTIRFKNGTDP